FVRLKSRHERRPELPVEPGWNFYPQLAWEVITKHVKVAVAAWQIFRIYRRVAASAHIPYSDQAMMPVSEEETQTLELFTHTNSAERARRPRRKGKNLARRRLRGDTTACLMPVNTSRRPASKLLGKP